MGMIATFDLGTTAVKAVFIKNSCDIVFSMEREITTNIENGHIEQDANEWYQAFCELSNAFFAKFSNVEIDGIIMSGQMQDVIAVDKNCDVIAPVILYNDQRGLVEKIETSVIESIKRKTANDFNGSIPLSKILWIKENCPEVYENTSVFLNSSKDYIICKLTSKFASDVVSLSTGGYMDIKEKRYISELFEVGVSANKLPQICYPDEIVGKVTEKASKESGFAVGVSVFAGSGDAGATTLASGIARDGEININLGTSGWVASVSNDVRENVFNLSAINRNLFINVVPVLNAGNVHKWIAKTMYGDENKYELVHNDLIGETACSKGIFFLPYLTGERFPVFDAEIKGCYIGITPNINKGDLVKSALEGVAFSIKQGLETLKIDAKKVSIIGGGGREKAWCQIFADVIGKDIVVYDNSEFLPCIALASVVKLHRGEIKDYKEFIDKIENEIDFSKYIPNISNQKEYMIGFEKFKNIYPCVKNVF